MVDGMPVRGLHQVALRRRPRRLDARSIRDLLRLRFIARFDPPARLRRPRWVPVDAGGVGERGRPLLRGRRPRGRVLELRSAGIEVAHEPALVHRDDDGTFGPAGVEEWMAFVHDPSGNLVELAERRPG